MTMLTNPSDEIVTMVTSLYNSNCTNTNTNTNSNSMGSNSNPFGMSANTNAMNAGSIFGGNTAPSGNTNLFGSSTATTNPFARNTAAFGAPAQTQPSSNLFGSSTPNQNNLFGGSNAAAPSTNLFGGSSFASNTNTGGGSMFGGNQASSVFGANAASGPFSQPPPNNSSPFAMSQSNSSSLFQNSTQMQNQNPTFGGGPTFGSQKTGLFAQASASLGQQPSTGSIFGQSAAQPQGFASMNAQTTQSQSMFGGQMQNQTMQTQNSPFGAVVQPTPSGGGGMFGAPQQQQQQAPLLAPQQQPSLFTQNATSAFGNPNQPAQPLFGNAQTTGFNQTPAATAPAPTLQQQQQSIFGGSSFANSPQAAPPPAFGSNPFQQAQEPQQNAQPIFGQQNTQNTFVAQVQSSATLYTPMEALSADEIEAFRSDSFDISKIPTKPPPMELCR